MGPEGNSLKCNFKNDKVEGKASIRYKFGREKYDGEIDENLNKYGKGTMEYDIIFNKNYKKYIGEWDKNIKKGKGILKNKAKEYFYKGNWYEGEIVKNGESQVYTK